MRLPLAVDAERLAAEVDAIDETAWRDHPEGAPGNTAVALIAVGGDQDDDATKGPMAPTPHLAALPYTRQVLAALGATVGRTRLMRIATETELHTHVDTNYYWWHHLRVHAPVHTTLDVEFGVGTDTVHMAAGEVWAFDTWRPHRVGNPAATPRIHLVIDTVGSQALWHLIEHDDQPARAIAYDPNADPEVPVEHTNWPVVMSSAEARTTLRSLIAQLRTVDPAAATVAASVLEPFQRDWRDLEARHGDRPEGWPARRALLDTTEARLRQAVGEVALPNTITLVRAVIQLVLGAALNPELAPTVEAWRAGLAAPAAAATGVPGSSTVTAPAPPRSTTPTAVPPRPARPDARALLAGPPRIADPIFVVCPPRSGSSLLFETLTRAPGLHTVGGESHGIIEGVPALAPAAHGWDSNRLTADDATDGTVSFLKDQFMVRLRDLDGRRPAGGDVRMLEKTPKNALRVPFLAEAFPDARFVYLYRDPRETVSSMLDAWRSGRFITYPDLPGWHGSPWSLLLTPGWRDLDGRSLAEVVTRQWATTVEVLLDDLEALTPDRWCVASYDRLVANPLDEITRLCTFLDLDWDDDLAEPLPDSRHTLDSPHPEKWRRNADELQPQLEHITAAADRARAAFATPPRTTPVATVPSADGPRRRSRTAEPGTSAADRPPAEGAGAAPTSQELFGSRHTRSFRALLDTLGASLVVSTYQAGRLIMIRPTADGLNSHFRSLATPMGMAFDGHHLAIGTRAEVIVFQNQPAVGKVLDPPDLHDGCFVTRHRHTTGDIRVHDLAYAGDELWVVNTRFSCLATLDPEHSFVPRWQPPFITALAAEDRCHLNGLAVVDGAPGYVTVLGISDESNGWREHKAEGGAVLDVASGAVVAPGLSMPHSPRWHDGRLWVLQSGLGSLGVVDLDTGMVETVARVPGFARGLAFAGRYALIGLSKVREHVFDGLPLTRDRDQPLECGVWVVDIESGDTVAHLAFDGMVQEIFEIVLLRGLRYPELVEPGAPLADTAFVVP